MAPRPLKPFDQLVEGDYKRMLRTVARQAHLSPQEVQQNPVLRAIARRHPMSPERAEEVYRTELEARPAEIPVVPGPVVSEEITRPSLTYMTLSEARSDGVLGYSAIIPQIRGRGRTRRIVWRIYFAEPRHRRNQQAA